MNDPFAFLDTPDTGARIPDPSPEVAVRVAEIGAEAAYLSALRAPGRNAALLQWIDTSTSVALVGDEAAGDEEESRMPAGKPVYTQEFRDDAVARVRAGEAVRAVAASLGVDPTSIRNWLRAAGGPPPPPPAPSPEYMATHIPTLPPTPPPSQVIPPPTPPARVAELEAALVRSREECAALRAALLAILRGGHA